MCILETIDDAFDALEKMHLSLLSGLVACFLSFAHTCALSARIRKVTETLLGSSVEIEYN